MSGPCRLTRRAVGVADTLRAVTAEDFLRTEGEGTAACGVKIVDDRFDVGVGELAKGAE